MLSNKNKKVCTTLNYTEHFLNLVFAVSVCMYFTIGLKISAIIARIKNYKSIIKEKKMKHDDIALLAKTYLDSIKDLISSSLTNSYIECDYFHLIDVLRKYDYMKEEINKLANSSVNYNL